jgi:hypothetical protein
MIIGQKEICIFEISIYSWIIRKYEPEKIKLRLYVILKHQQRVILQSEK